jgi:phosphoribosylanthranilate isomerase
MCGMMRPEEALAAARAGADAIGMVFYAAAKRCITINTAREIIKVLPPFVTPVGLFVNAAAEEIEAKAHDLGLRYVQLHGEESPAVVASLRDRVVLKAVRVDLNIREVLSKWREAIVAQDLTNLRGVILDTGGVSMGGSGIENNWDLIQALKEEGVFDGLPPVILAGGLVPETVASVVRRLRPWAVDVSSGVEETFGRKSIEKMTRFAAAVREAAA